jgi:hypothetical protein
MSAALTRYRQCLRLRNEGGPQYCWERVSDAHDYVDDVSFYCGFWLRRLSTDGKCSGYVISQIPSQLICTRGKAVLSMCEQSIRSPFDTYTPRSPPLPVVSELGVVLGHRYLCDCFGQDNTSVVRLSLPGWLSRRHILSSSTYGSWRMVYETR